MRFPWREQPEAGRTALAYYEAGLRRWRKSVLLPLILMGALALAAAIVASRYAPHGQFFAGMWVGVAWGAIVWIWGDPPERIAKWKRGAEGERRTWKALRPLEHDGWRSFHDRDGKYGNLDHIVVGRAGVFLLDSKNLGGCARLEEDGLTIQYGSSPRDRFTARTLEAAMRRAAVNLKESVEATTNLRVWVQAVVVVWPEFSEGLAEGDRVIYVAGERLRDWLSAQQPRLQSRNQRLIELALEAELVAPPAPAIPTQP